MELKYIILLFFCCFLGINCQQCYLEGKVNGVIHDAHSATSYNDCLNFCKNDTACSWFTFYASENQCAQFSLFDSIDMSCTTCLSGERNCSNILQCDIDGFCNGVLVDLKSADSERDCLILCQDDPRCQYYAYHEDGGSCALLEDCIEVLPCDDCHSGEKSCSITSQGKQKIMNAIFCNF